MHRVASRRAYGTYCRTAHSDGIDGDPVLDVLLLPCAVGPEFLVYGAGRAFPRYDGFGKLYTCYAGAGGVCVGCSTRSTGDVYHLMD